MADCMQGWLFKIWNIIKQTGDSCFILKKFFRQHNAPKNFIWCSLLLNCCRFNFGELFLLFFKSPHAFRILLPNFSWTHNTILRFGSYSSLKPYMKLCGSQDLTIVKQSQLYFLQCLLFHRKVLNHLQLGQIAIQLLPLILFYENKYWKCFWSS